MQIVLSFKIMCNQRSHHKDLLQPLSFHQCAQEADRSMPLETNICPTVNTWTSWFLIDLRLRNSAHELHNELLPPSLQLLETAQNKANHKMRGRINENFSLTWRPSSPYVDDTSTMKYPTNPCDMWLFLWCQPRHPLGQERLFVHGKALVHRCHVCFFNLAGIPVILSKSNISPIFKNSYVWRFYTCWSDCSWLPNCIL